MNGKPRSLRKGDLIGIIAPASPPSSAEKIYKGAEYLERLGYRVTFGKNIEKVNGYLAGTDQERADDIHTMFTNKNVRAIFTVRGGYGTPRLLPLLDYSLIRNNPKILVGYSDITALQLALYKKTGLISFSGPMSGVEMFKGIDPFTEEHFWAVLTSTKKLGIIVNPDGRQVETIAPGKCTGPLLGGSLSLITTMVGSSYLPSFKQSILFFEEIEEETYRFDRMMNQLRLSHILKDAGGVIVGDLTDVKASDITKPFLTAEQVIAEYLSDLPKPAISGLAYGHVPVKLTIPIGIKATLDADNRTLRFDESCVR
ncbi:MAG: LD-carboxypeptidase [Bacteroidota bacterium]